MSSGSVVLRTMTPDDVDAVVVAAAAGASPVDVMPPDEDPEPETWTPDRRRRYATFLRSRLAPLSDGRHEASFLVLVDGAVAGVARVLPTTAPEGPDAHEVGLWLGAAHRGRGVGRATLDRLVAHVRDLGGTAIVAETTLDNHAALALLRGAGSEPARRGTGRRREAAAAAGSSEVVASRIDLR